MKVVLFGAAGQVGRALAASAPPFVTLEGLDRSRCDITDRSEVERVIADAAPELVINAAAYTAVDRAELEPEAAALANADAPGWMALAARTAGARFVHLSTDFVFAGDRGTPYLPTDPTNPASIYGLTKRDGESAVRAADEKALIVRTAWVYGASGRNFVRSMLQLMRERDQLTVVADQVGTPTYAPWLACSLWNLAQLNATGTHHATDAGVASWYDFAVAIQEEALAAGLLERPISILPIRTEDYPTPARRPLYSVLDKSSTWALLGAPAPHWRANLRCCMRKLADSREPAAEASAE